MPRSIIKCRSLDIKPSLLDDLIDAYLSDTPQTRQSVARKCGVSASTSGKVATALVECGFADQRLYADKGSRPALHLYLKEGLRVMVIDLSRSVYTMSIIDPDGKCHFSSDHQYDAGISYEDNLNIFLSRSGYAAKLKQISFYAVAVILTDTTPDERHSLLTPSAYIPTMLDKDKTDNIIRSVFNRQRVTYLKCSDALSSALKFEVVPVSSDYFGISYIFMGSHICAFNVSKHGVIHCDLNSFIVGDRTLGEVAQRRIDSITLSDVLSKVTNMLHCAYGSSSIVIDSDVYDIDETVIHKIRHDCAKVGVLAPTLIASSNATSLICLAAAKVALSKFIRTMISSLGENV